LDKHTIFVSSSSDFDPDNMMPHSGLVGIVFWQGRSGYAALLDNVPKMTNKPFADWWAEKVFVDSRQRVLTRKDLVLTAADQDGGAHVDPKLNEIYSDLHSANTLGWRSTSGQREIALGSPVYPAIRQISHEVMKTLIGGYSCQPSKKYDMIVVGPSLKNLGPAESPSPSPFASS